MDKIMVFKDHYGYKYMHGIRVPRQSKDKMFIFQMLIDPPWSDVDLLKHMQVGGDIENCWLMFDHVKQLTNYTTLVWYVYDNKYCKVLAIVYCDIKFEDVQPKLCYWYT